MARDARDHYSVRHRKQCKQTITYEIQTQLLLIVFVIRVKTNLKQQRWDIVSCGSSDVSWRSCLSTLQPVPSENQQKSWIGFSFLSSVQFPNESNEPRCTLQPILSCSPFFMYLAILFVVLHFSRHALASQLHVSLQTPARHRSSGRIRRLQVPRHGQPRPQHHVASQRNSLSREDARKPASQLPGFFHSPR